MVYNSLHKLARHKLHESRAMNHMNSVSVIDDIDVFRSLQLPRSSIFIRLKELRAAHVVNTSRTKNPWLTSKQLGLHRCSSIFGVGAAAAAGSVRSRRSSGWPNPKARHDEWDDWNILCQSMDPPVNHPTSSTSCCWQSPLKSSCLEKGLAPKQKGRTSAGIYIFQQGLLRLVRKGELPGALHSPASPFSPHPYAQEGC